MLARDLDDVGEPACRDQRDARTAPFEQRVGRDRRAVREHVPDQRRRPLKLARSLASTARARVVARRQHLGDPPVVVDGVGERPAGVDPESARRRLLPDCSPAGRRSVRVAPSVRVAVARWRSGAGSRGPARCGSRARAARSGAAAAARARRARCGSAARRPGPHRRACRGRRPHRTGRAARRRATARPATATPSGRGGAAARRRRAIGATPCASPARLKRAPAGFALDVRTRPRDPVLETVGGVGDRAPFGDDEQPGDAAVAELGDAAARLRASAELRRSRWQRYEPFVSPLLLRRDASGHDGRPQSSTASRNRPHRVRAHPFGRAADADRGDDAPVAATHRRAHARDARPRARRRSRRSPRRAPRRARSAAHVELGRDRRPTRAAPCRPNPWSAASPRRAARCRAGRSAARARATQTRCVALADVELRALTGRRRPVAASTGRAASTRPVGAGGSRAPAHEPPAEAEAAVAVARERARAARSATASRCAVGRARPGLADEVGERARRRRAATALEHARPRGRASARRLATGSLLATLSTTRY